MKIVEIKVFQGAEKNLISRWNWLSLKWNYVSMGEKKNKN